MVSDRFLLPFHVRANRLFDRLVTSPSARRIPGWFSWILVGGFSGIALASMAAWSTGYSPWMTAGTALGMGVSCLGLAMARKIWTGEESYAFYHYLLFIAGGSSLVFLASGESVRVYLDFILLAVALSHAVGRVGCLVAGCCHGKPHAWGVCYDRANDRERPVERSVGDRLFPVQALESLLGFILTVAMVAILLAGLPAGTPSLVYVTCYAMGRFFLEFRRGDPERPYYGPLSEAQWVSVFLLLAVAIIAAAVILPLNT